MQKMEIEYSLYYLNLSLEFIFPLAYAYDDTMAISRLF